MRANVILSLLVVAIFVAATHSQSIMASSLFDDMRNNYQAPGVLVVEGKVKHLKIAGNYVWVQIEQKKGGLVTQNLSICDETTGSDDDRMISEEMRAASFQQRVSSLRRAQDQKKNVVLNYRGPWNPCLESVELASE